MTKQRDVFQNLHKLLKSKHSSLPAYPDKKHRETRPFTVTLSGRLRPGAVFHVCLNKFYISSAPPTEQLP